MGLLSNLIFGSQTPDPGYMICYKCKGKGETLEVQKIYGSPNPEDYREVWVECDVCHGEKQIPAR